MALADLSFPGNGGMKATKGRVLEQANERLKGLSERTHLLPWPLGSDRILVLEQLKQGTDRTRILVLPVGQLSRHLAYSPDCGEAGQLVFSLLATTRRAHVFFRLTISN